MENDVSATESGGVERGNENCYGRTALWSKRIDHFFLLEKRRQDQGKRQACGPSTAVTYWGLVCMAGR